MILRRKTIAIVVALLSIALCGLILVQSILLASAYHSKEETFRRSALAALGNTALKISSTEMFSLALDIDSLSGQSLRKIMVIGQDPTILQTDSSGDFSYSYSFSTDTGTALNNDSISLNIYHHDSQIFTVGDSTKVREMRMVMVTSVLNRLNAADAVPIEDRLDVAELDSLLHQSLADAGIDIKPSYGVQIVGKDSLALTAANADHASLLASDLRARLFPLDLAGEASDLVLFFPDRSSFMWWQMAPLMLPTILLTLIVIGCFVFAIRAILSQKRFAGTLVDFINNMTHEFRTPISTVQLACEAIERDDIIADPDRVRKFSGMILSESRRMKDQSDRILQMALLERGEYELKRERVDVHDLITNLVESISLHVSQRNGHVDCDLRAVQFTLYADPTYLANIIHNLLDNANKYSPDQPHIKVTTDNAGGGLNITVADKGIGLGKRQKKMVFDKYFRVNQGDRHDVKGFGLGLSFVKLMVEAHDGTVSIESTSGEGTSVHLAFDAEALMRVEP